MDREPTSQMSVDDWRKTYQHAQYLKSLYGARNEAIQQIDKVYLMKSDDEPGMKKTDDTKVTLSPTGRNKVLGAARLLQATEPTINVPADENLEDGESVAEELEKMANVIWKAAGRVRQQPLQHDIVLSALLYSEMHMPITRTSDLVEQARRSNIRGQQIQAESIERMTPYVFDVWHPYSGYPEIGTYGLFSFYSEKTMTNREALLLYPNAKEVLGDDYDPWKIVTVARMIDYVDDQAWLLGKDNKPIKEMPIGQSKHQMPFIPMIVQLGEGTRLFKEAEYQRQPLLYTLAKSKLWERQNLLLTVMYTMAFTIGANPTFLYRSNTQEANRAPFVNLSMPGGVVTIGAGEDLQPLAKNVIDPALREMFEVSNAMVEEATIYSQTLGEPLGGADNFSMTALLHQAGRLPLLATQRLASWAIGDMLKAALLWMKHDSKGTGEYSARYGNMSAVLDPSRIPDTFEIEANLEIDLPQDEMQNAQVAIALTQGENPLASVEWARENILKINQPIAMQEQIWSEQAAFVEFGKLLAETANMMDDQDAMDEGDEMGMGAPPPPGLPVTTGLPPEEIPGDYGAQPMQGVPEFPPTGTPPEIASDMLGQA